MQAVIVSNWKDIGVDAEVKNEQSTTLFTDTLNGRKFHGPTAIMFAWVMGPESNLYSTANSTQIPTQSNGWSGQNYTGFRDERVDLLTEDNLKQLDKKKIYVMTGPNGGGKSSIAKAIMGIYTPTSGKIFLALIFLLRSVLLLV